MMDDFHYSMMESFFIIDDFDFKSGKIENGVSDKNDYILYTTKHSY